MQHLLDRRRAPGDAEVLAQIDPELQILDLDIDGKELSKYNLNNTDYLL